LTEQDRFIILNYMQNRGFADAKVDLQVEEIEGSRELEVILSLDRGPRYRFGRVSFAGNQLVDDETLHSLFTIEDGAPFSVDGMRETSTAISDYYGRRGYIDAYANFQPSLRLDKAAYDVHFQIVEGEQYRVGMIKVYGNTTTHPDVILNECLLIPGEVFNSHKLQQTEARLQNIGYFESVNVYAIPADDDPFMEGPRFRDIHIEVCETSTGDFGFSAGFSSSENAFIGLNYTERNFNWRGIPRIFEDGYAAIRGGGEHFALRADFGSSNHRYALSWTEPYFCNSDWALGFDADHSSVRKDTNKDNGFSIDSYGFSLHATRIINQFLKFSVHYRLRDSDVDLEKAGEAPTDKRQEAANAGFISGAGFNLLYDSTNHPMFPSCGIRSRLLMEYVGFGGPHNFLNFGYFNSYYYSPRTGYIMKLRADAHFLHPVNGSTIQSLPFAERLYLGGEGSLRGYEYNAIGPRYSDGSPRGGLSSLLFSWEYDYKCFPIMDVFTFVDAGALSQSKWTLDNWSATAGYGARLYVMGGGAPVTLGYGWPLWEKDDSIVDRFFITLGSNF
jgi:outer membrane protein insertion porin family